MKKKYTLEVANSQIDIVTDESKETIDAVVGIVDRKIREVYLHSKGECSRTNAAILVCLDYCAERLELQKTVKNLNAEVEHLNSINELAEREKAALEREILVLRESLKSATHKHAARRILEEQIALDEVHVESDLTEEPIEHVLDAEPDLVAEESLTPPSDDAQSEIPHIKLKKKKVRAMFDNISFDDI